MLQFEASSARGGGVLLIGALVAMMLAVLTFGIWPELAPQQAWLLLFLLLSVTALVGYLKLSEPVVMLQLDEQGLIYHHRFGDWRLKWQDLTYAKVIEIDGKTVNYVGFRLNNYQDFLAHLSLRLAVRLIIEQRSLLIAALGGCKNGQCPSTMLEHCTEFAHNGVVYRGVLALFAQRMDHFRSLFSTDIIIPADVVGFAAEDFCRVINQHRLKSLNT